MHTLHIIHTSILDKTHKQMHDDEAWSQFAGKSRTSFSLSRASRQKWWLPAFKTRLCLREPFILLVFNLKMVILNLNIERTEKTWCRPQSGSHGLLPKHLFSPTSLLRNSPPRQLRYKTWFCLQGFGGFQPQNRSDRKDLVSPTKWLRRPSCL